MAAVLAMKLEDYMQQQRRSNMVTQRFAELLTAKGTRMVNDDGQVATLYNEDTVKQAWEEAQRVP